mmetsp:Transcript_18271/g.42853  ORF Transcript_18271/g.42853 Transcript_18271/m.42853 type:complete len:228 (-) Transcript_18271:1037-1720(-)
MVLDNTVHLVERRGTRDHAFHLLFIHGATGCGICHVYTAPVFGNFHVHPPLQGPVHAFGRIRRKYQCVRNIRFRRNEGLEDAPDPSQVERLAPVVEQDENVPNRSQTRLECGLQVIRALLGLLVEDPFLIVAKEADPDECLIRIDFIASVLTPVPQRQHDRLQVIGPSPGQKMRRWPGRHHIHKSASWATVARTDGARAQSSGTVGDDRRQFVEVRILLSCRFLSNV